MAFWPTRIRKLLRGSERTNTSFNSTCKGLSLSLSLSIRLIVAVLASHTRVFLSLYNTPKHVHISGPLYVQHTIHLYNLSVQSLRTISPYKNAVPYRGANPISLNVQKRIRTTSYLPHPSPLLPAHARTCAPKRIDNHRDPKRSTKALV